MYVHVYVRVYVYVYVYVCVCVSMYTCTCTCTVEPLIMDSLRGGHNRNNLYTKETHFKVPNVCFPIIIVNTFVTSEEQKTLGQNG